MNALRRAPTIVDLQRVRRETNERYRAIKRVGVSATMRIDV